MVSVKQLKEVSMAILKSLGEDETNAELAADAIVRADMRGVSTHGAYLLTLIWERFKEKVINLPTKLILIKEDNASTIIDGGNGLGQIAASEAMNNSIRKAEELGIGITLVRNTNNVGFLGYYTELASKQGMIGVMGSNAAASMAPWGGAEACFGTNPVSIAIPVRDKHPLLLDMSSSIVARGKIRKAARNCERIPEGWAIDKKGSPTSDPHEALAGTILPIGGPKGSGLAMMVDIIAGMLSGSKYGPGVKTFHKPLGPTGVGVFCTAININSFCEEGQFYSMITDYINTLKNTKKAEGFSNILMPGELEFIHEGESINNGIRLDANLISRLNGILKEAGCKISLQEG